MKVVIEQDETSLYYPYDEAGHCLDHEGFITYNDCQDWCISQGYVVVDLFNSKQL